MFNEYEVDRPAVSEALEYCSLVPYNVIHRRLYTPDDLFDCYDPKRPESFDECYDTRVYRHMVQSGKVEFNRNEALSRCWHDQSIRLAMKDMLAGYRQTQVVGIMGGHALLRSDAHYRQAADIAKALAEEGFLMVSGGGPGAMEATHLGAWMAGRSKTEMDDAIRILSEAPSFQSEGWLAQCYKVKDRFPQHGHVRSLAVPTWFYGHEPPSVLATDIAKFFDNSQREDLLLTIAYGGLVFMPGSAGTVQEIFQEAVQDHYVTLGFSSPMVFVGRQFWDEEVPVRSFMQHMIDHGRYQNMLLSFTDDTEEVIGTIRSFEKQQRAQ